MAIECVPVSVHKRILPVAVFIIIDDYDVAYIFLFFFFKCNIKSLLTWILQESYILLQGRGHLLVFL